MQYNIPKKYQKYFFTPSEQAAILLLMKNGMVNEYHYWFIETFLDNLSFLEAIEYAVKTKISCNKLFIYQNSIMEVYADIFD